ncbi:MAG: DoxX family protein [Acidobacteriota bacterium]
MRQRVFNPGVDGEFRDLGLLMLRIGVGGLLLTLHGWGKLDRLLDGVAKFPDPLGIGSGFSLGLVVLAEVACALAVVLGFATRIATLPIIIAMSVAFFVFHGGDPMGEKELALFYLLGAVALLLTGPGRFSMDEVLHRKGRGR